ncbi:hypothetical protein KIN20_009067 [Parelaphostrongylus tenuis]|uniref:Uncharacterized protein n=1 Tax=Parelaphostrongylus tenuis TaxID=148309 RepID=A0AAD5MRA8_PARTN|nr:hypothetical protein KIN20_009067 [Parelaphostrongylus tenuis]
MKEARRLSANRGAFNSITSHPPPRKPANAFLDNARRTKLVNKQAQIPSTSSSLTSTIHPTGNKITQQSELKTTTKAEERKKLKEIIGGRPHLLGARNMALLTNSKKPPSERNQPVNNKDSMQEFIKKQPTAHKPPQVPKLGAGLGDAKSVNLVAKPSEGPSSPLHDPARLRAIAILRRKNAVAKGSKPLKRKSEVKINQEDCKRSKLASVGNQPNLDVLLKKKSIHESESNKAQSLALQKHLDSLEQTEKVENICY